MSRGSLGLSVLALTLGACGASAATTSTPSSSSAPQATGTSATPTTATTAARPPRHHHRTSPKIPPASNVRLPATYVIGPGGALSPPTISAPASVQVDLTAISGDGRSYTLRLVAPGVRALSVPAGGRASASIAGLKDGAYAIDVDGARRGALVVGVSPGP